MLRSVTLLSGAGDVVSNLFPLNIAYNCIRPIYNPTSIIMTYFSNQPPLDSELDLTIFKDTVFAVVSHEIEHITEMKCIDIQE